MRWRTILLGLLAPVLFTGILCAQSDRGSITGTVTDPSGGVVPAVQIAATNIDTKVQNTATTNDVGLYSILNLPIGRYSVVFTKPGFKTYDRDGITIGLAQVVRLDAQMQVGALTESVTVTAEASILQTEQTQVGANMRSQVVTDLPLSISGGRSLENFAYAVTPGVEGNNWTSYIAGGQAFTKEVLIDGTSGVVQIGGHIGESSPTMEAVEEFKVETSGVRAEDGRTGGGVFKFTLKSGTNAFHGSAFGFIHNEVLNANTWQNNFFGTKRPMDRQNAYGFSAGGPIIKNRTFFFAAFEKYTQENLLLRGLNKTVPVPEFLDGDFSALLDTSTQLGVDAGGDPIYKGAIIDPTTGLAFPGNVIPSNRISGVSQKIVDIFREGYQPLLTGSLINNSALPSQEPWFHQTQLTFKVDHNISDRSRLASSLIWTERPRILVDSGGIWNNNDAGKTGGPLSRARMQEVTSRAFRLSHNYSISPSVLNIASFTYGRYRNPSISSAADGDWPNQLGFGDIGAGNFPEIDFGEENPVNGVWTDPIGYSSSGFYVGNTYIANESLTWVRGRQTLRFGGEIRSMQLNSHAGFPTLAFNFTNNQTGAPAQSAIASQVGFGFASFLLGEVGSASQNTPFDLYGRKKSYSIYVQDDFKVSSKLSLTLDLRWDATGPLTEKYGHMASFDKLAMHPTYGIPGVLSFAQGGKDSFETARDWKEFAPHVGVAYQVAPRTVLRAAYGVFYSPISLNYWSGVPYGFAPGYRGTNEVRPAPGLVPAFNWDNGYPGSFVPGNTDPDQALGWHVNTNPRGMLAGYVHQWNAGAEFELSKDLRLDVTYMANRGRRLQSGTLERNQPDFPALSSLVQSGHEWDDVYNEASAAAAGVPYPFPGFGSYAFAALMDYPQLWQNWNWSWLLLSVGSPLGRSDYNSLQIGLTKRAAQGLTANVSYTLSNSHGNVQDYNGGFQETWWSGPIQDVTKLDQEAKTVLFYDQTHTFKGIVSWNLPFGHGKRFLSNAGRVANAFVGGWTLSSAFRYNSGWPLGVNSSNWYPGWDVIYANVNTNGDFSRQFDARSFNQANPADPANRYFDGSNFSNPAYGELGTGPMYVSQLRTFGTSKEDIGLLKDFRFAERFRIQLRFEFYNLFNRHYFNWPVTEIGSPLFGNVTSTNPNEPPRNGQFGARFEW